MRGRGWVLAAAFLAGALVPGRGAGQGVDVASEVFVGSEVESYLRTLQVAGLAGPHPWSVRAFSPAELDALLAGVSDDHPWRGVYQLRPDSAAGRAVKLLRPRVQVIYNSAFPTGDNDGAVWAGRGITTAVEAGVAWRRGPVSVTLNPIVFRAENEAFELMPNGQTGALRYADPRTPTGIDLPQRFGDEPYTRVDPGQSTVRLELRGVTLGASTANQHWGPAARYPILLGGNAAGFPHLFLGTAAPREIGPVRVHGRLVRGMLAHSAYSSVPSGVGRRIASGASLVLQPRAAPDLEVGGALFQHALSAAEVLGLPDSVEAIAANRLASAFVRWVLPGAGLELYGEYAREDASGGIRDLLLEPDHTAAYTIGLGRVWASSADRLVQLRGELVNAQASQLARGRGQGRGYYRHSVVRQGHTQRGQALGSPAAAGGAGAEVALDLFHPGGRWSLTASRELLGERLVEGVPAAGGADDHDVRYALGGEALWARGGWEVEAGVTAGYEIARHFAGDAFNARAHLGVRRAW